MLSQDFLNGFKAGLKGAPLAARDPRFRPPANPRGAYDADPDEGVTELVAKIRAICGAKISQADLERIAAVLSGRGDGPGEAMDTAMRIARHECREVVSPGMAFDSVSAVYREALNAIGVDTSALRPSEYAATFRARRDRWRAATNGAPMKRVLTAAAEKDFFERFPEIARIKVL